eukprot:scaffold9161_cov65-Phaeocystis_antarctica.AAC.2
MNDTKLDELVYVAPAAYSCRPECHIHVCAAGPTDRVGRLDAHVDDLPRRRALHQLACPLSGIVRQRLVVEVALAARAPH